MIFDTAEQLGIQVIECEVHGWEDAPHAHMDVEAFIAALDAEAEYVSALFDDLEIYIPADGIEEAFESFGIPLLDPDEREALEPEQEEGIAALERM